MRTLLLALLVAALLPAHAQLNMDLKAHWTFAAGSTADISGFQHNGSIVGTVLATADRAGNVDCALHFPGDASHVEVPYAADFDIAANGAFTVGLWYQGGSSAVGDFEWLFAKRTPSDGQYASDYAMNLYDVNRALVHSGTDGYIWSPIVPPIPDAVWHHIAYVYSSGIHQLWQDNVLQVWDSTQQNVISTSQRGLIIGEEFEGSIDDIRFYDRALPPTDINLLYQDAVGCSTLTGIAENGVPELTVAPTPTSNTLTIRFGTNTPIALRNLELFDATGGSVLQMRATNATATLQLEGLQNGLYLLRCGTGPDAIVRRVVKE